MVSVEFNRFLNYYKKKKDLSGERSSNERSSSGAIKAGDAVRYFINIGSRDDFNWMKLKDFLREALELGRDDVFKVDVKEGFSFFNTDGEHAEKVMDIFANFQLEGRKINVEISKNDGGNRRGGGGGRSDFSGKRERRDRFNDHSERRSERRSDRSENRFEGRNDRRTDSRPEGRRSEGRRSEGRSDRNPANKAFEAAKRRRKS